MCIIHEHQTQNHLHYYSDTEGLFSLHETGHVVSFLGVYICLEVEHKGDVFKMKCCLIIMRCLCQVETVAVILFFIFCSIISEKVG